MFHQLNIGNKNTCFIIAEIGINHNGDINLAKELIDIAVSSGANCVKFQKRCLKEVFTQAGLNKPYINHNSYGDTYGAHKEYLEFTNEQFIELQHYSNNKNILFTASGWDKTSIDFLNMIEVPFFKMASADLTNTDLLIHTAKKNKPIIISTGMASMDIVQNAYDIISQYNTNIAILQCTSSYPTPFKDINLNVIPTYIKQFPDTVIGFSNHSKGIAISTCAVALGAQILEVHITKDRTMRGSDHSGSLEPMGLTKLIRDIHALEQALGTSLKEIQPSEDKCVYKLCKSVTSTCIIPKGTIITQNMLCTKSPFGEQLIRADKLDDVVGKIALNDINNDENILYYSIYE
jgi:sialic acid synthase